MGITVTTNLSLIKPDTNESIEANMPTFSGWATQNGLNSDKIDSLFRMTTHSYTPTWSGSPTAPTLGAGGFVTGKYIRVTPKIVFGYFQIFCGGAGFAVGAGTYRLSIPCTMDPDLTGFLTEFPVGKACYLDASAVVSSSVFNVCYSVGTPSLFFRTPNVGGSWSDTIPVVPAQNDRLSGYFMYPTRDA
jgi:hypothetical protein